MSDPLDLEALKESAKELREYDPSTGHTGVVLKHALDELDRAIEIAELEQVERKLAHVSTKVLSEQLHQARQELHRVERERGEATHAIVLLHQETLEGEIAWCSECQTSYPCRTVRISTAHYEHRQAQEGEA